MNINFQNLIPQEFDDNSRVWVYQSSRAFSVSETLEIENLLQDFSKEWFSHGEKVKGYANLFFGQFIIIIADESNMPVGGCSTDSSVRMIKNIAQDYNVDLLDRLMLAFIIKERIQLIPLEDLNFAIENNSVNLDTLYFNNTILTKKELLNKWIIPVKDSWLAGRVPSSHINYVDE
jgi:hypothetical protein